MNIHIFFNLDPPVHTSIPIDLHVKMVGKTGEFDHICHLEKQEFEVSMG